MVRNFANISNRYCVQFAQRIMIVLSEREQAAQKLFIGAKWRHGALILRRLIQ